MSRALPRHELSVLSGPGLKALDGCSFIAADPMVDVPCRLKLLPGSDRLFVMLNGAVDRAKPLPVFARWNWGKVLGGHVLAVCDPTLFLDDELRLGWFVGNRSLDPMAALLRVATAVQSGLGIEDRRAVFYGSSGGGFASLIAAASRRIGRAIVVNPQTEITAYYPKAVDRIARVFAPEWTAQQSRERFPLRWSALEALAESRRLGRDVRVVYAQNVDDQAHHSRHFLPFCNAVDAPPGGGLSADNAMLTHVYSSAEGHGAEPPEVVRFFAEEGLAHLLA